MKLLRRERTVTTRINRCKQSRRILHRRSVRRRNIKMNRTGPRHRTRRAGIHPQHRDRQQLARLESLTIARRRVREEMVDILIAILPASAERVVAGPQPEVIVIILRDGEGVGAGSGGHEVALEDDGDAVLGEGRVAREGPGAVGGSADGVDVLDDAGSLVVGRLEVAGTEALEGVVVLVVGEAGGDGLDDAC